MFRVWQKEVPQAFCLCTRLELFDDEWNFPRAALLHLAEKALFIRVDVLVHECTEARLQLFDLRCVFEIHNNPFLGDRGACAAEVSVYSAMIYCRACRRSTWRHAASAIGRAC